MSSVFSVHSTILYVKSNLESLSKYIKQKSTTNKWQSGLIYGSLLFFSSRYIYNKLYRLYYSLPPGPEGIIPKIGVSLYTFLNPSWHIIMAKTYGPIMSFYSENKLQIIINDSFIAKKVLQKQLNRRSFLSKDTFNLIAADDNTPPFTHFNGDKWLKMKQIVHNKLMRVLNTKTVNIIVNKHIDDKFEPELKQIITNGKGVWYSRDMLSESTFNVIFQTSFGESVDFKNNKLSKKLAKDITDLVEWNIVKRVIVLKLFPYFSSTFLLKSYVEPAYELRKRVHDNIQMMINERKKNKLNNSSTFMDQTAELVKDDNNYTESQEIADIFVMFVAGTDTTSITLEWGLILLAKQQDIQNKIRNELKSVLIKNNIDYKNSSNIIHDINLLLQLPLFRALIHEILRISCVLRLGVQHQVDQKKDDWIKIKNGKKYRLPKGSSIHYNVECIHYNKLGGENWTNSTTINPTKICLENWLKDDNKKFSQNESFLTFGYGKRDCIGRQLAIKEMRIILGYLLLNYKFSLPQKYKNIKNIPFKGGVRFGAAKPTPQIPIIIQQIF